MEMTVKIAWLLLAAIHVLPALPVFDPGAIRRLYGLDPAGPLGLLLTHRGALFLAVLLVALLAAVDPGSRRAALLVTAVSMIGFLLLYLRAGAPSGPLRTIALVDLAGLLPLAVVTLDAIRSVRA